MDKVILARLSATWDRWSDDRGKAEVEAHYQTLKKMPSTVTLAGVRALEEHGSGAWDGILRLLQRRTNRSPLSPDEVEKLVQFDYRTMEILAHLKMEFHKQGLYPPRERLTGRLKKLIRAKCVESLGPVDPSFDHREEWLHVLPVGSLFFTTHCDVGGSYQLSLSHGITERGGRTLIGNLSLNRVVALPPPDFDLISVANLEALPTLIAEISSPLKEWAISASAALDAPN